MAAQDGIVHMVATPHANDRYFYDREYLTGLLRDLQRRIGPSPQLSLGCDFHLSYENMQSALVSPERYCIAHTRYLLVEFSNFSIPLQVDQWLAQMLENEIVPILTHPERNPILQQSGDRVLRWVEQGCAAQITASALTGAWGKKALQMAQWLLKKGAVHMLATDAHDISRRPPVLSEARNIVAEQFGEKVAQALVATYPQAVINNAPPPWQGE